MSIEITDPLPGGERDRITIRMGTNLLEAVDAQVEAGMVESRSEFFRAAAWRLLELQQWGAALTDEETEAVIDEMPPISLIFGGPTKVSVWSGDGIGRNPE